MAPRLPFAGFYQLGFIGRDLDRATARLAARYGIERVRRKRHTETLETAHAYAGEVMVEVSGGKQQLRTQYTKSGAQHAEGGGEIRRDEIPLHHQDYVQQYFEEVRKAAPAAKNP